MADSQKPFWVACLAASSKSWFTRPCTMSCSFRNWKFRWRFWVTSSITIQIYPNHNYVSELESSTTLGNLIRFWNSSTRPLPYPPPHHSHPRLIHLHFPSPPNSFTACNGFTATDGSRCICNAKPLSRWLCNSAAFCFKVCAAAAASAPAVVADAASTVPRRAVAWRPNPPERETTEVDFKRRSQLRMIHRTSEMTVVSWMQLNLPDT